MTVSHRIYGVLATGTTRFQCHLNTTFLVSFRNFSKFWKRKEVKNREEFSFSITKLYAKLSKQTLPPNFTGRLQGCDQINSGTNQIPI